MRFTRISRKASTLALVASVLWACQGDDNTLPAPADASTTDAHADASAVHDGGGDADAGPASLVEAAADSGPDSGADAGVAEDAGGGDAGDDAPVPAEAGDAATDN